MTDSSKSNDHDEQKTSIVTTTSLSNCGPIESLNEGNGLPARSTIRRPQRDEAFMRTGDPVKLACVVDRNEDNFGQYAGESYFPVAQTLQDELAKHLRLIAFHPCASQTSENFILPQKLQLANTQENTWNISLAESLSTPPGQWMRLWSDRGLQQYEFELVDIEPGGNLEYPDFKKDLETALSENIINDLEHPMIQRLMASQSNHNGWDTLNYDF